MIPLRHAKPRRKRAPREHTNSSPGVNLALVVSDAPRGLRLTGDVAALDSLDVRELARRVRT